MLIQDFRGAIAAISSQAEIILDKATIEDVRACLIRSRDYLTEVQPTMTAIPVSATGGSPLASQLATHSRLANEHLLDTIDQINAGLERYDAAMLASARDLEGTEDLINADLLNGRSAIDSGIDSPTRQG